MSGLTSAVEELAAEDVAAVPDAALAADLVELRRVIDRLEGQFTRRLAVFDRRGACAADGMLSTASWLRSSCRLAPRAASGALLTARALADRLPVTAVALAAGDVSIEHAGVLARATETLPEPVLARAEGLLVDTAREWDPAVTARAGARVRHVLDTGGEDERAGREHAARRLHVSRTFAGMVAVDGLLEPAAGELVLTALQALSAPQPGDGRTPGQRRADALEEMSRRILGSSQLAECGGERPHVTVTVDLATLQARPGTSPAEATWVGPLRGEDARRLACDAGVSRVLTDGPS